jgi:Fe-S-cluster containining protein
MKEGQQMTDCTCKACKDCCWRNPGWFGSIEEVIGAAKIVNLSLKEFAQKFLIQEYWCGDDDVSIPAPRRNPDKWREDAGKFWKEEMQKNGSGFIRASWGHNFVNNYACILLDENNSCIVHKSKPMECRETYGCKSSKERVRPKLCKVLETASGLGRKIEVRYDEKKYGEIDKG